MLTEGVEDASTARFELIKIHVWIKINFRQPDEVFKILHVRLSVFCRCRVTKMLLNTVLNSATARQFRDTIFKILRVRQYRISSILSRSVQNIRLIECYLVRDHQEVVKYLYSLTFTMQISTTSRQTSNCMHIITDKLF